LHPILITAKGGMEIEKVNREFRETEQEQIPFRSLGYQTLDQFLADGKDFCRLIPGRGTVLVQPVMNEATRHVQVMVSAQRNAGNRKKNPSRPRAPMRRYLKSDLSIAKSLFVRSMPFWSPPNGAMMSGGAWSMPNRLQNMPIMQQQQQFQARQQQQQRRPQQQPFRMQQQFRPMQQQPRPFGQQPSRTFGQQPSRPFGQQQQQRSPRTQQQQQQQSSPPRLNPGLKKELEDFCRARDLPAPVFKPVAISKRFVSTVLIGEQRFR